MILGRNTSGKTTLMQAFNWCLYENVNFKQREIINLELLNDMDVLSSREVYVEISLVHENKEYIIHRKKKFTKNANGNPASDKSTLKMQYKEKNGEQQSIPSYEIKDVINKILPEDLSSFFFFDGEKISSINRKNDVVEAVRNLMGLNVICSAKDDLDPRKANSVTAKFLKELEPDFDKKNINLKSSSDLKKEKLESFLIKKDTLKSEIKYFEEEIKKLHNELLKHKDSKRLQEEKRKLESDVIYCEQNINSFKSNILSEFNNSLYFFAIPLIKKTNSLLKNLTHTREGIPNMRAEAIEYILERGCCICGNNLKNNKEAIKNIEKEKELLPPQYLGTIIGNFNKKNKFLMDNNFNLDKKILNSYKDYRNNIRNLDEKKAELKEKSEKIKNIVDVRSIENNYIEQKRTLKEKKESLKNIEIKIGIEQNDIQKIQKDIERIASKTKKNERLKKCLRYSEEIYKWLNKDYITEEQSVKDNLLNSVNNIFNKMYHGNRKITIDDNYRIKLLTK